jgi:hypothetical protein
MPVRYWSFAGLILTYWCNARCASCYLSCDPQRDEWFELDDALGVWEGLTNACPHGCRIHLGGGEPFGKWESLIELCRSAKQRGLAPPEKVETNAFWATDEKIVRERLFALDAAGMRKLVISADPYHQQFVPIERCRLAARVAEGVLGPQRVQVRWRDWLAEGFDTANISEGDRIALFTQYAQGGRDRLNGRAAELLAGLLPGRPIPEFSGKDLLSCGEALLRSRHVHVGPDGLVVPGVCAGIVLGRIRVGANSEGPSHLPARKENGPPGREEQTMAALWQRLSAAFSDAGPEQAAQEQWPIVSVLARSGPRGLLESACRAGFVPGEKYAGKCHLCWEIRRFFVSRGMHQGELAPAWLYGCGARCGSTCPAPGADL